MNCVECGSPRFMRIMDKSRVVKKFDGETELLIAYDYQCRDCGISRIIGGEEIAPRSSRYHWEVLHKIVKLRKRGKRFREIKEYMANRKLNINESQAYTMLNRYKRSVDKSKVMLAYLRRERAAKRLK